MSGLNYLTSQAYDLKRIAQTCQDCNVILIVDLAHAAGTIPLELHEWGVDAAAWCSYKYMCCGPGADGGIFVHEKHLTRDPGLKGWFGVARSELFKLNAKF